ncbi:MAG: DNA recombination protein RmuC [Verrucomicrobiota bacterium]|nr:DNA recombination protein RmuC [Verrucomicrobiota bacterium]MCC6819852.1 DNA recombination protein RmuC [Limisphaerales bacterium]
MPLGFQLLIVFVLGGLLGLLFGWLMARGKPTLAPSDQRLENELRQQLTQREGELSQSRNELVGIKTSLATAQANQASAERLLTDQRALQERTLAEARESQTKALADLREAFKALSADALKQTAPEFLRLAEQSLGKFQETAKGDLAQRQEAIKGLVEPLKQQLDTYQKRLQQSETAQADTLGKVKEQLTALAASSQSLAVETAQFRSVLKSNQARGRWGEETLRRVVEAAGMSAHCDFTEQAQADDKKPDLLVKLPGDRFIIVDAKVPELDFLSALEVADPTKRAESLAAHAGKLKATIKALADRDYPRQFPNALDYVVLFLPAESLFSAALEGDHDLIVWAANKRIMLATPASLIALLRSVSVSWQQHAQTENAQKIAESARELYSRVVTFTEHFERIRDGLEKANDAFNKASASFQSRVRPAGERLAELGGGADGKSLADLSPLETAPQKLL